MTGKSQPESCDVVVLCWDTPTASDRNALRFAAFMGAKAASVSLTEGGSIGNLPIEDLVPHCTCLIVDVETLANATDAIGAEAGAPSRLTKAANNILVYGFRPGDRHGVILRELSSRGLLGVLALQDAAATFQVAPNRRQWCGQLSGLSAGKVDISRENGFVEGPGQPQHDVLILAGGEPFFVRASVGPSQVYFLACGELADLDAVVRYGHSTLSWFSRLAPLTMFLRAALGNRIWHNDQPRACFIIDDPLLKQRHGFVEYTRLLGMISRLKCSASIAFIPWNYQRTSKRVAALVSSSYSLPFLCVHGCDHTAAEFESTDFAELSAKAELALDRMQAHQRLYGVPFEDVMVFPQGRYSAEAVAAVRASGYLASVNGPVSPTTGEEPLTLRDLLEVAICKFSDFPLFARRYPRDLGEFAFDLFLGKPALGVEHHGYFREGYGAFESFVGRLNSIEPRLEWTSLARICSQASLTRTDGDDIHVRFYTSRFSLTNYDKQTRRYLVLRRQPDDHPLPLVTVDGRAWSCGRADGHLEIRLSLVAGETADIRLISDARKPAVVKYRSTNFYDAKVLARRLMCEFRDNYVDTTRGLRWVVAVAQRFRQRRKARIQFQPSTAGSLNAPGL